LKKMFVEKADIYEFLDPFTTEFQYDRGKAGFTGNAAPGQLVLAISESVMELAEELDMSVLLRQHLKTWREKYQHEISKYEIEL